MEISQPITIWEARHQKAYKLTDCYYLGWEIFHKIKNNRQRRSALRSKLHAVIKSDRILDGYNE